MYVSPHLCASYPYTIHRSLAQITSEGYTIPEKAVMEHNMLSLSRIYENIYFSDLAAILHIDSSRAEKVTRTDKRSQSSHYIHYS